MRGREAPAVDSALARGLRRLRRRRMALWGLIAVYLPAIWLSLRLSGSDRTTGVVFAVWALLLLVAVLRVALVACPRCGKPFHLNGVVPLYLRRCLHCGLHINADKNPIEPPRRG